MITHSRQSAEMCAEISKSVKTFHHHFHVIHDIASTYPGKVTYVEIGCYEGASACLMIQRPETTVISIDTGDPIAPNIAEGNIYRHNKLKNDFRYIKGSSHDRGTLETLRRLVPNGIDILFIDGGHSYNDVIQDFNMYADLVSNGGYIVFDDYLDSQFSPEVRPAVDWLVSKIGSRYEVIGSLKNDVGAYPAEVKESNCFILRKNIPRFGIIISTYQRPDGKTPGYLNRALSRISLQTYQNYHVYVIGDKYENNAELKNIVAPYRNVTCINLPRAIEREKYPKGDMKLWCTGGNNAALTGIAEALKDGIKYICHHDHDDFWEANHLELINKVIDDRSPFFVCTMATYGGMHLPFFPQTGEVVEFMPVPGGMITSASCIKYSDTELRGRDVFEATGKPNPADADLWYRMAEEMKASGKKGYLIKTLTCHHDEEGYTLHG